MEVLFDNFELLIESPGGIKKLRELILQLAIMGKLVPQDPADEPAAGLLEKIKAEKERLIKEGKIKGQKPLPEISEIEKPFNLPDGWYWVRLGEIGQIIGGGTPKTGKSEYFSENGISWLTPADLYSIKGKYVSRGKRDISLLGLQKSSAQLMPAGAVLFSSRAPIGYVAIAANELSTNQGFKSCVPYIRDISLYLYYYLKYSAKEIDANATGTTFKEVSGKTVSLIVIPLPPLNEQKRIVEQVERLMAICDELEKKKEKRDQKRVSLNNASLEKLLASREADEFRDHWGRINENFDILYDSPGNVVKLKQAILQLAVMGKLVPQDPEDEPAAVLLKKIKEEKERLIKEGKIKKQDPLPPIAEDEMPYKLPKGWEWSCLYKIGLINPRNTAQDDIESSFVPMSFIAAEYGVEVISEKRLWKEIKNGFTHFSENDVSLAKITPCFENGKSSVMRGLVNGIGAGTTELHIFRTVTSQISPQYVLIYLKSPKFINEGISKMTGSAGQKRVPKEYFAQNPFPLPPLNEQKRIVARVERLMSYCDRLQENLQDKNAKSDNLFNAVVNHLQDFSRSCPN